MISKQFKALTVLVLAMAVAVPEMVVPAGAFSPAQVGAGREPNLNLDNSNLLTEVDSDSYWRKRRHGSSKFDGRYYRKHSYNNGWKYKKHHRHHRRHHNDFPYGLAFGLGLGGLGYGGGYGYDGYYDNRYYVSGGDHVEWCLNRYKTYNPRTDTFIGYDGRRHRCNSPY